MPEVLPNYIAVEGIIGVGKTSLAELLADRLDATLMLEEASSNPFLADFYRDRRRYAFPTQMFFLMTRYQQQQRVVERDLFISRIVSDYIFDKDQLFASVTLSDREQTLYNRLAQILKKDVPRPDLVIYLQASTSVLQDRIRQRNREFEKFIGRDYLEELNEAYNSFFFHYNNAPLLVINTDELNFVRNEDHLQDVIDRISRPLGRTTYYTPPGNRDSQAL